MIQQSLNSDPVRVTFCSIDNYPTINIKKGKAFNINVSAINHVGNPVNAIIQSSCSVVTVSGVGHLKEGQTEQRVGNQCTELV